MLLYMIEYLVIFTVICANHSRLYHFESKTKLIAFTCCMSSIVHCFITLAVTDCYAVSFNLNNYSFHLLYDHLHIHYFHRIIRFLIVITVQYHPTEETNLNMDTGMLFIECRM